MRIAVKNSTSDPEEIKSGPVFRVPEILCDIPNYAMSFTDERRLRKSKPLKDLFLLHFSDSIPGQKRLRLYKKEFERRNAA